MTDSKIKSDGGPESITLASQHLSDAFKYDPSINYLLGKLTPSQRDAYRPRFFEAVLTAAVANNASIDTIDDFKSCGVMMPPGCKFDSLSLLVSVAWHVGLAGFKHMLFDFPRFSEASKAKAFSKGEKYYYVVFLGTDMTSRGNGLSSSMVRHYQAIARKERLPIYIESSTETSWRLYEKLGFVTVYEDVLGVGEAGADGTEVSGGSGWKLWGMVWRP